MEVTSQHCETVPNKTNDILKDWKDLFEHDSQVRFGARATAHIYIQFSTVQISSVQFRIVQFSSV